MQNEASIPALAIDLEHKRRGRKTIFKLKFLNSFLFSFKITNLEVLFFFSVKKYKFFNFLTWIFYGFDVALLNGNLNILFFIISHVIFKIAHYAIC